MALDDVPDHYATLELGPDCSIEDINRAYKKLAMKNHPDRNRGHEQEAVARFQAVQAAHEVLKEQDSRRRYDLSRRLPTANGSASTRQPTARGNPYKATSNFPPPPMRTNPTRQTQNTANRGAHRGAEGFTHFPPPPPPRPQPKTSTNKDAKDRANMFEAWQSMHGRKSPERKAAPTASPRMNTPQGGTAYGNNLDPRSRPQRAKSDDSQKSAYDASKWHKPFVNLDTKPGPPPRRGGFDPSTPSGDERPAPVSGYSQNHVRSDHDNAAGYTQRGPAPTAKKPEPPGYFDTTSADSSRKGTPHNADTGERTKATAEDLKRPASTPSTATPNQGPERGPFGRPRPRPAETTSKYYSSSDSDDIESAAATARSRTTSSRVGPDTQNRPKAMPRARRSGTTTPLSNPPTSGFDSTKDGSNIFTFPVQPDTFDRTFRPLPEKINTNFTGSTRHIPAFGSPPPPPPSNGQNLPTTYTFPLGNAPPQSGAASMYTTPFESPQPRAANPPSNAGVGTWSSAQWSQTLQTDNWASQWANPPPLSFASSQSPQRRSKSVKGGSIRNKPRPENYGDEEAGPDPTEWTDTDSNAMDVDMTEPADTTTTTTTTITPQPTSPLKSAADATPTQPRTVYVEPLRAEWSGRSVNGHPPQNTPATSIPSNPTGTTYSPSSSPRNFRADPVPQQAAPMNLTMNDFRNVAPFANDPNTSTTNNPLNNLKDISTSLPFDSKASTTHPSTSNLPPLELPKLPRPPTVPAKLTDELELLTYLRSFSAYLAAWATFKKQMLALMVQQTQEAAEMENNTAGGPVDGVSKDIMRDWLIANGETEKARGWASYSRGIKQAERSAEYWGVAVGRHGDAVGAFDRVRERLRGS